MRTGAQARDWALGQVEHRNSPYGTWYRYCLAFVRLAFDVGYAKEPVRRDAGAAWDMAEHKHHTDDPSTIPFFVPVFWELPSVADHVAFSVGNGWCISNDILRLGYVDKVPIATITSRWGGQLLGWTEDLVGNRIWTPPTPKPDEKPTPNITAYFEATDLEAKVAALRKVIAGDNADARPIAERLLKAHEHRQEVTDHIGAMRKALHKEQVR